MARWRGQDSTQREVLIWDGHTYMHEYIQTDRHAYQKVLGIQEGMGVEGLSGRGKEGSYAEAR